MARFFEQMHNIFSASTWAIADRISSWIASSWFRNSNFMKRIFCIIKSHESSFSPIWDKFPRFLAKNCAQTNLFLVFSKNRLYRKKKISHFLTKIVAKIFFWNFLKKLRTNEFLFRFLTENCPQKNFSFKNYLRRKKNSSFSPKNCAQQNFFFVSSRKIAQKKFAPRFLSRNCPYKNFSLFSLKNCLQKFFNRIFSENCAQKNLFLVFSRKIARKKMFHDSSSVWFLNQKINTLEIVKNMQISISKIQTNAL